MTRAPHRPGLLCCLALALTGCGFDPGPGAMKLSLNPASEKALADAPKERAALEVLLERLFGTRAGPRYELIDAWKEDGTDPKHPDRMLEGGARAEFSPEQWSAIVAANRERLAYEISHAPNADSSAALADTYPSLAESAELFRTQCLHCHGVEGGGDGPTGATISPKPRDFRKGIFKFTAVKDKARPRREDLEELLERGVDGTAMPSFLRLSLPEREGLVDYVRLLAIRGEVESLLVAGFQDDEEIDDAAAAEALEIVWGRWQKAREKVIAFDGVVPPDSPAMRARGRELFLDPKRGNCVSCHGAEGKGDGALAFKTDAQGRKTPAYRDDWGFEIMPRDFTSGVFRGGSRPIDIYRRVYAGINGTPMPGIGETKGPDGELLLSHEDLWALVHYVRSLAERAH
ncbi:MAG: cytochrome c [Planctomycetes bacterium]|nr:cytochrome c [Planctomycetota bacterium]